MDKRSSLLFASLVAACDRPDTLVICHNANCVEPTDPANDDTIPALRDSLALRIAGMPAIDGTEIDSFWRGSDGACGSRKSAPRRWSTSIASDGAP